MSNPASESKAKKKKLKRQAERTTDPHLAPRKSFLPSDSFEAKYPETALQWHPTKNGPHKPNQFSAGSHVLAWWKCNEGKCDCHEWEAPFYSRGKLGYGCPFCCKPVKAVCEHRNFKTLHPDIAAQWHPTKNGDALPETHAPSSKFKRWWICNGCASCGKQHEWQAAIDDRTGSHRNGCPYCANKAPCVCECNTLKARFPEETKQLHPTLNDLDATTLSTGSKKMATWTCDKCPLRKPHIWKTRVHKRTGKSTRTGCPYCCNQKLCEHNSLAHVSPNVAKEWHSEFNDNLLASDVVNGSHMVAAWKCSKCEHEWKTGVNFRTRVTQKTGCPNCCASHMETAMHEVIQRLSDQKTYPLQEHKSRVRHLLPNCELDHVLTFLVDNKTIHVAVEMDGIQHFDAVELFGGTENLELTQRRDRHKNKMCVDHYIHLLRIDHTVKHSDYHPILCEFLDAILVMTGSKTMIRKIGPLYAKLTC